MQRTRSSALSSPALLGAMAALGLAACSPDGPVTQLEPELVLDKAEVDLGNVQVGASASQIVLLRNRGNGRLTLSEVKPGARFADAFDLGIDDLVLEPNEVAQLRVVFAPLELGEAVADVLILSDDPDRPEITLPLRGVGVTTTVVVEPESLSFGNVVLDTEKRLPLTLTNNSDVDAQVSLLEGNNVKRCQSGSSDPAVFCVQPRDRTIDPSGRFTLLAGETATFDVAFAPAIAGVRERGTFVLRACEQPACDTEIRLDGVGIEQGFRCEPESLDFGQVNPGSCVTDTVSCENIANEQVTVVGWGPSANPPTSDDFEIEPGAVQVLNEGDRFDVDVTYCPETLGNDEGSLQIETDQAAPHRFVQVPLVGTGGGPDIDIVPGQCNFGLVSLIAPSRCTLLVTNVGFDDLEISDIVPDTAGTGAFTAPGAGVAVIGPGESYEITVEFQPLTEGPVESTLLVRSNDQDEAEAEVRLLGEGIDLPPCDFEVAPTELRFGVVQVQRFVARAFEIRNVGSNDCLVTSARLEPGSDPEFSLPDGNVQSTIITPGSSYTIRAEFAPQAPGNYTGAVEFSISSQQSPFNRVPLSGSAAESTLLIVPNEIDFGTIGVGCATRNRVVQIYNTGSVPATIDSIAQAAPSNAAFVVGQRPAPLPGASASIPPGQSVEFAVSFRADAVARYAGAIEIIGTFEGNPVTYIVSVQGEGALDATQEDRFEQLGTPKVDILFVIDFTGSMSQEQSAMAANFQAFIQFAQAQAIDYQIGVTTTDTNDEAGRLIHADQIRGDPFAGPFANRIVSPNTQPDPETVFGQNVQARTLTGGGAADEAGFYAAYQALTPPLINGHNAGFLRRDAVLSIVFVSDEAEQTSTGIGAPANDIDFYVNFMLSIKGFRNTNLFTASAIVGDNPSGCSGAGGDADPAPRYIEAARRTGGVVQSICTSNWSRSLEELSNIAFGFKSRFFLTNQPVISTIVVLVDGVEVPATAASGTVNWTYDFSTNSVNFSPFSIPEPRAQILVRYTAECL